MGAPPQERWLFGPFADLFFGCGVFYFLMFGVMALSGDELRRVLPASLIPLVALVSGAPHFGATLLRVYARAEDRRRYALFGVFGSLAVWALFAVGVHSVAVGSLLLTAYLTFGPWHYAGQNYGIALVFLRRRGVDVTPALKRWIHASYVLAFAMTVIAIHAVDARANYQPVVDDGTVYHLVSLGIPGAAATVGLAATGAAYLLSLAVSFTGLLRRAPARDLIPAALLAASQALWFTLPLLARHADVLGVVEPLSVEHAAYAFLWVAVAHSVQYLWIATYYELHDRAPARVPVYWLKTACAGAALWAVPALLFAPGVLGRPAFDGGLELMVAVAVNLQHFLLDGAIWKLRDGRIARVLLRPTAAPPRTAQAAPAPAPGAAAARALAWSVGAASVALLAAGTVEREFGVRRSLDDDPERVERAIARLGWIGRDSPNLRTAVALAHSRGGDLEAALRHAEAAVALGAPWQPVNNVAWAVATDSRADPSLARRAVRLAEFAREQAGPAVPHVLDTLAAAYASAGRYGDAARTAQRAVDVARARGEPVLAGRIRDRLLRYREGRPYRSPARPPPRAPG